MPHAPINIGIDVGGTNIKAGAVDEHGHLLAHLRVPTDAHDGQDAILASVKCAVREVLSRTGLPLSAVHSIGIGVPGTADAATGVVVYAPNLFWRNVPVRAVIEAEFARPVWIAQDTRAATWAEYLVGAGQGMTAIAGVTLGTGIGCGLVFDGRIFHGGLNTAGEFGHQIVNPEGHSCNCGRRGCLEAHAGGLAIVREARHRLPDLRQHLSETNPEISVDEVYALSLANHPVARQITDSVVRYVGIGLVNLINLTSVELVSLSGGISNAPASLLLDPLITFVRDNVYETVANKVQLRRSALGEDAPLIGAALLHHAFAPSPASHSAGVLAPGLARSSSKAHAAH